MLATQVAVQLNSSYYWTQVKREDRRPADAGTGAATPAVAVVCCQFMVAMVVLDAWQYGWHSWHHRLVAPYAYGAQYNHPLEGLILDTAGGALALAVTGMAPLTAAAFFSFATLKAVDDHSGVLVPGKPLHLLFRNNTAAHAVHHQVRGGRCNYAQLFFVAWDKLMGTYVPYEVVRAPHGGLEAVPLKKKLKT